MLWGVSYNGGEGTEFVKAVTAAVCRAYRSGQHVGLMFTFSRAYRAVGRRSLAGINNCSAPPHITPKGSSRLLAAMNTFCASSRNAKSLRLLMVNKCFSVSPHVTLRLLVATMFRAYSRQGVKAAGGPQPREEYRCRAQSPGVLRQISKSQAICRQFLWFP